MPVNIVIETRVKEFIRAKGGDDMRCDGSLMDAINAEVECLLEDAITRAKGNDRKTVRPSDL
jgi:histone H3/H4